VEDEWSVLGRSSIPDGVRQQMLRHTEPGAHETGMLQVLVLARSTRPTLAYCTMPHGHRQVHTCGMEVCELTAVALTVAPPPPPRSLGRVQASMSPRLA
jgi:hypothetical protein